MSAAATTPKAAAPAGPQPPATQAPKKTMTCTDNRTGKSFELPIYEGTQGPGVFDIAELYPKLELFTYDPGFKNTVGCKSAITFIDGNKGILQYRGYDIGWILNNCDHMDVCYLLLKGDLPHRVERKEFVAQVKARSFLNENMKRVLEGFRQDADPMAIMVGAVGALSAYYDLKTDTPAQFEITSLRLIAKMPTLAAWAFRYCRGEPFVYPRSDLSYAANFLWMLFSNPGSQYHVDPFIAKALDMVLVIHADAEQTSPTTTVRTAGSSQANPVACIAAGLAALWGPANRASEAAVMMLETIGSVNRVPEYLARSRDPRDPFRLQGYGHRAFKVLDPRSRILRELCQQIASHIGNTDPVLDVAMALEDAAAKDEFCIRRRLYPNVNYYSGVALRLLGFPTRTFTAMLSVGRTVGWVAQWKEMKEDPKSRIVRPRQLYIGKTGADRQAKL